MIFYLHSLGTPTSPKKPTRDRHRHRVGIPGSPTGPHRPNLFSSESWWYHFPKDTVLGITTTVELRDYRTSFQNPIPIFPKDLTRGIHHPNVDSHDGPRGITLSGQSPYSPCLGMTRSSNITVQGEWRWRVYGAIGDYPLPSESGVIGNHPLPSESFSDDGRMEEGLERKLTENELMILNINLNWPLLVSLPRHRKTDLVFNTKM